MNTYFLLLFLRVFFLLVVVVIVVDASHVTENETNVILFYHDV